MKEKWEWKERQAEVNGGREQASVLHNGSHIHMKPAVLGQRESLDGENVPDQGHSGWEWITWWPASKAASFSFRHKLQHF